MTKKVVLKLGVHDEKEKKKAMKAVSSISGIESLAMDMKEKKLTVIGDVDPVEIVGKLKKLSCHAELLTVGPAKEPEKKKEEPKKEEPKKEEPKKTDAKKTEELLQLWKNHYPQYTHNYPIYSVEENPNSCVIC